MHRELHISIGLPGSGKTTVFKKLSKEAGRLSNLIECDQFLHGARGGRYKTMEDLIKDRSSLFDRHTYLDGLFLTRVDVDKVLSIAKERNRLPSHVIIHYWNPNVEACLWNDQYRRDDDSNVTIENADMDTINKIMGIQDYDRYKGVKFSKKTYNIERKPGWKVFSDKHKLYVDEHGIVKGDSWSLGGTWNDCWGNTGTVSPSTAPDSMTEFDDLLEKVAPSISFLQYKKISKNCVSIREYSDGDYYGGSTYHNQYLLDLPCLYEYLIENELIN
jgi:adenylate kinase family enzyme